jgi:hypothetical protein
MSGPIRTIALLAGLLIATPVVANDLDTVQCSPNEDRVWVYSTLTSFDVEARLRCSETVEILGRVKGYVRVRTASGLVGYVPEGALPDLPVLENDADKPVATLASAAKSMTSTSASAKTVATIAPAAPPAVAAAPAVAVPIAPVAAAADPATPAAVSTTKVEAIVTTPRPPAIVIEPAPDPPAPVNQPVIEPKAQPDVQVALAAPIPTMVPVKAVRPTASASAADDFDQEEPLTKPENESADPACRAYFSAYGLTPKQWEWLADNRRKEFAEICPAPDLARVDFVILFTHDEDSFYGAMPVPVHVDGSGFSDFNPMGTVDTARVPSTEIDRAHDEFVWVFRMRRGAFDPARFSPRRKPQFATAESKGSQSSTRTVEDAFQYMAQQSESQ